MKFDFFKTWLRKLSLHEEKIKKIEIRENKIFEFFVKYGLSDAPCCIPTEICIKGVKMILNDHSYYFKLIYLSICRLVIKIYVFNVLVVTGSIGGHLVRGYVYEGKL